MYEKLIKAHIRARADEMKRSVGELCHTNTLAGLEQQIFTTLCCSSFTSSQVYSLECILLGVQLTYGTLRAERKGFALSA
jgi:hypothetical protein